MLRLRWGMVVEFVELSMFVLICFVHIVCSSCKLRLYFIIAAQITEVDQSR